jgi:class 3 adenylate cyclase/tetratricopeptide (TPR) repeat protein
VDGASIPLPARDSAAPPRTPRSSGPSLQVAADPDVDLSENRRLVTVMFADLSGSTALGEELDPEDLRRVLTTFFTALAAEIQRFGGTVDKYIGDAVMAVFGAPVAHEDDAERAISAALAMHSAIERMNGDLERHHGQRLALRIGVNTGEVVAGLLHGDTQGAYTVVGDTVNTAQRFESAAPLGEIIVSQSTWNLARSAFEFEMLAPLLLKGKAEPQMAYRVLRRRVDEPLVPVEASPLVGRQAELNLLRAALADGMAGHGRAVHVVGEAGVGKTRLLREFRGALDSTILQVVARCASFEQQTPYALMARLLRSAVNLRPGDDETTARAALIQAFTALDYALEGSSLTLLLDVLGYGERGTFEADTMRRVLVSHARLLLSRGTQFAPLVVVTEDLHWIDSASSTVLAQVVRDLGSRACLFISTARVGWTPPWQATQVQLDSLSAADARAFMERLFDSVMDDTVAEAILERTGGNPFFIEEVVRELSDSQVLVQRGGRLAASTGQTPRVPATVQEVIQARLDRLPDPARRVLHPASVCGRSFWYSLIERLVSHAPLPAQLALLERESFVLQIMVEPERTYIFRHALIQEVTYQSQLQSQRRTLHGAVGAAIEALYADRLDELVDMLAYHYARSDEHATARQYLLRAGHRADRLYANEEALAYFRDALRHSADDALARALAFEGLGDVQRRTGAYDDALASFRSALDLRSADEPIPRATLLRKSGTVHQLRGNSATAVDTLAAALDYLPDTADRERALVMIEIGQVHWQQGRFEAAIDSLAHAVQRAEQAGDDDAHAAALRQLGTVHVLRGDANLGLSLYQRSLELYERLDDVFGQGNVLNNIGVVHRRAGRYAEAHRAHMSALSIRVRIGDPLGIGTSRNNLAQLHLNRGSLAEAEVDYQAALDLWQSIGYAFGVAMTRAGLGIACVEQGSYHAGREHLHTALREWEQLGSRTYVSETQRYLALAYVPDDAVVALEWAERAVSTAREMHAADQEGVALQVLGRVRLARGEADQAIPILEQSRDLLSGTTERQELGRTLAALGQAYSALTRTDPRWIAGEGLVAEAHEIFVDLGAELDLVRLRQLPA